MEKKRKIWNEAREASRNPQRIKQIVNSAGEKLKKVAQSSDEYNEFTQKTQTLISMLKVHIKGDYRAFSKRTMLLIVFGLLYFVIPTDVLPDFIPALGFTDDLSVIYFIYRQIDTDISRYLTDIEPAKD